MEMVFNSDDPKERDERQKWKTQALHEFMEAPLTRAVTSQFPEEYRKGELLQLLLSAAFDAGFNCGAASIVKEMAGHVIGSMQKPRKEEP